MLSMSTHKRENSIGQTPWVQLSIGRFREALKDMGTRGRGGRKPPRVAVAREYEPRVVTREKGAD